MGNQGCKVKICSSKMSAKRTQDSPSYVIHASPVSGLFPLRDTAFADWSDDGVRF